MNVEKKHYVLTYVLHDPSESTEPDLYMAEAVEFPNCVAWGDTPEETVDFLQGVVEAMILTYLERGYVLPPGVLPLESEAARPSETRVVEVAI